MGVGSSKIEAADYVVLLPSCFVGRPATIFFERPPDLPPRTRTEHGQQPQRVDLSVLRKNALHTLVDRQSFVIKHAFLRAGFKVIWSEWSARTNEPTESSSDDDDDLPFRRAVQPTVFWARHSCDWADVPSGALINHFPGTPHSTALAGSLLCPPHSLPTSLLCPPHSLPTSFLYPPHLSSLALQARGF